MKESGVQDYIDAMFRGLEEMEAELVGKLETFSCFDEDIYKKVVDITKPVVKYYFSNISLKGPGTPSEELLEFTLKSYKHVLRHLWNHISKNSGNQDYLMWFIEETPRFITALRGDTMKYYDLCRKNFGMDQFCKA